MYTSSSGSSSNTVGVDFARMLAMAVILIRLLGTVSLSYVYKLQHIDLKQKNAWSSHVQIKIFKYNTAMAWTSWLTSSWHAHWSTPCNQSAMTGIILIPWNFKSPSTLWSTSYFTAIIRAVSLSGINDKNDDMWESCQSLVENWVLTCMQEKCVFTPTDLYDNAPELSSDIAHSC